jgi:hypothetical protein
MEDSRVDKEVAPPPTSPPISSGPKIKPLRKLQETDELYQEIYREQGYQFPVAERKSPNQLLSLTIPDAEQWLAQIKWRKAQLQVEADKVLEAKVRGIVGPLIKEAIRSLQPQSPSKENGKRKLFSGKKRWGTAAVVLLAVFIVTLPFGAFGLVPFIEKSATATPVRQQGSGSTVDPDTAKVFRMAEEAKMFYQN